MKRQFWYRILIVPLFVGLFAGVVAVTAATQPPAVQSLITVNSTADDLTDNGNCTLREAIHAANMGTAVDICPAGGVTTTIMIPAGTYTLTIPGNSENNAQTGDLDILSEVTIIGASEVETILNGNNLDRIFDVRDAGDATISHLTITGGGNNGVNAGGGGARAVEGGAIHLSHVHVTENTSHTRGGLAVLTGTLTIEYSQITQNVAAGSGGGISNSNSPLTISHSLIAENEAVANGGGLMNIAFSTNTSLMLTDSEVLNNVVVLTGDYQSFNTGRTATVVAERVTITGNSAARR
ncbi:MAG: CSLREA domain-containing protein [Chloroflexi bacterium]|nr:CSLREA domain-containing protein [Chloroflexota bacterium]